MTTPDWSFEFTDADPADFPTGPDVASRPQDEPRLSGIRTQLLDAQNELGALVARVAVVENTIRECASEGVSADTIADHCGLAIETVRSVIDGGTIFGWPPS
jgi:hypothetical protein